MGQEKDLLINYPKTKRDVKERGDKKRKNTEQLPDSSVKNFSMGTEKLVTEDIITTPDSGSW